MIPSHLITVFRKNASYVSNYTTAYNIFNALQVIAVVVTVGSEIRKNVVLMTVVKLDFRAGVNQKLRRFNILKLLKQIA